MEIKNTPLILLSAGNGERAGKPKGLIDVKGSPWLETQLKSFAALGGEKVYVVLGAHFDNYAKEISWLAPASADKSDGVKHKGEWNGLKFTCVRNAAPERGQFSSILVGLKAALEGGMEGYFILPVDTPVPNKEIWLRLAEKFRNGKIQVALPEFEGRGGHPALVRRSLAMELVKLKLDAADSRLDAQIHKLKPEQVARIPVESGEILRNLNTAEDFSKLA